jgi:hypothetical protein
MPKKAASTLEGVAFEARPIFSQRSRPSSWRRIELDWLAELAAFGASDGSCEQRLVVLVNEIDERREAQGDPIRFHAEHPVELVGPGEPVGFGMPGVAADPGQLFDGVECRELPRRRQGVVCRTVALHGVRPPSAARVPGAPCAAASASQRELPPRSGKKVCPFRAESRDPGRQTVPTGS